MFSAQHRGKVVVRITPFIQLLEYLLPLTRILVFSMHNYWKIYALFKQLINMSSNIHFSINLFY